MTTGTVHEHNTRKQQMERHIGCMAGFLHIFDRHQILSAKSVSSTKRLPPPSTPTVPDSTLKPEKPTASLVISTELERTLPTTTQSGTQPKLPVVPLPVFEFREGTRSSWKFAKEAPRLSLDSRAVTDTKGTLQHQTGRRNRAIRTENQCDNSADGRDHDGDKDRRSPSVVARLMGLGPLPNSIPEPEKKVELRRSASESRVNKNLFQYDFADSNLLQLKQPYQQQQALSLFNVASEKASAIESHHLVLSNSKGRALGRKELPVRYIKAEPAKIAYRGIGQKKSFFDSADFFPEPKHKISIYGDIEKRLRMRGMDEPSKDLETLKQTLEALQLKGLLHSKKPAIQTNRKNSAHDGSFALNESPIVVMKPVRSGTASSSQTGTGRSYGYSLPPSSNSHQYPRARRTVNLVNETLPTMSPSRGNKAKIVPNVRNQNRVRSISSPTRVDNNGVDKSHRRRRLPNNKTKRNPNLTTIEQRRIYPIHSSEASPSRQMLSDQQVTIRPTRTLRKPTAEIYNRQEKVSGMPQDELSTISESNIRTTSHSQPDTERSSWKVEEYKEGRNLLERCDKLLNNISTITASKVTDSQPSPVSVLDSSIYKDESCSPSPVMKRHIDYEDEAVELEDDTWSLAESSDECGFQYVSEIVRASTSLPEDYDVFMLLEKQQHLKGKDSSRSSRLGRRLIFDTISEILRRNRRLPPWKAVSWMNASMGVLNRIWCEFRRIQKRDGSEDLFEMICGVLKKDLVDNRISHWEDCPAEMGEMVLDIERLVFKDLIGEAIRDIAAFSAQCKNSTTTVPPLPRKLVF